MEQIGFKVLPIIFFIIGVAIFRASPKSLLSWDRRTGYWIYKKTLKSTNDEEKAIEAAGVFYKIFGAFFALFSLLFFILTFFAEPAHEPYAEPRTIVVPKVQDSEGHT